MSGLHTARADARRTAAARRLRRSLYWSQMARVQAAYATPPVAALLRVLAEATNG